MVSKATKSLGVELSRKYSFRNRKQISSEIEETQIPHESPKKNKRNKRQHITVAFEKTEDDVPKMKSNITEDKVAVEVDKKPKWEPKNWYEVVENIREMRKDRDAPVDTMGCDKCMDETASPEVIICTIQFNLNWSNYYFRLPTIWLLGVTRKKEKKNW